MSDVLNAQQTDYWKQQAYALMVQEGLSSRFAKGQLETDRFIEDIMQLVTTPDRVAFAKSHGRSGCRNDQKFDATEDKFDTAVAETMMFKLGRFIGRLAL